MPNNNHGIQIHNFQNAKNGLKEFSKNIPSSPNLPTVETDGGIFGWFDHKVTGSELNKLTKNVQSFLIATNNQQIKVIREFEQVYETFECLDKDYIQGILLGIKAAEKASDQATNAAIEASKTAIEAKKNGHDVARLVQNQGAIVDALVEFKERLGGVPHIDKVLDVWDDIQTFKGEMQSVGVSIRRNEESTNKMVHFIHNQELKNEIIEQQNINFSSQARITQDEISQNKTITNERFEIQEKLISRQNNDLIEIKNKQEEQNESFASQIAMTQNEISQNRTITNERFEAQEKRISKQNNDLIEARNKQAGRNESFASQVVMTQNEISKNKTIANERFEAQEKLISKQNNDLIETRSKQAGKNESFASQIAMANNEISQNKAITNERFEAQEELISSQNTDLNETRNKQAEQNESFTSQFVMTQREINQNKTFTNERFEAQEALISKQNNELIEAKNEQVEKNESFSCKVAIIQNEIRENELKANEKFDAQSTLLLKKIKIAYTLAGSFGAVALINIVLTILKIV